ncbi:MAG TPA: M15 family metallopeptidase [Pyrinomonadaceae bacterium]|nr:M15 family metallopeptidase [Pyrinomonadaceae bacterium]
MIKFHYSVLCIVFACATALDAVAFKPNDDTPGTLKRPIVDSRMTEREAFDGLDPACPKEIRDRQRLVTLKYYSFDNKVHQGQLVLDKDLVADIKIVFAAALAEKFPIQSVIPISDPRFRKNGRWDDDLSMIANNTSSFNYRLKTGGTTLSNHATGRAVDINTVQNPYIKGKILLPPNGKYDPAAVGTFTPDNPIVKKFLQLGWTWGGTWASPTDYQHFEKPRSQPSRG